MNRLLLCRILGMLGMLVGGSMLFSLPWAFPIMGETDQFEVAGFWGIVASIICSLGLGGGLFLAGRNETGTILRKEALAAVGLGWMLAGFLGSLPYLFSGTERSAGVPMTVPDALFESISGFTTTGASVLTQLEAPAAESEETYTKLVPRCILFWRSFTHWLGGMGIIVLFVAILGQLGAGGKALMRREVPGPLNETLRPRVRETAILMWVIYVVISLVLVLLLMLEGMSLFDALCHSFGTMATGGFSTYNASVAHFDSVIIEMTILAFMIAAGTNFSLYYLVLRGMRQREPNTSWWSLFKPMTSDPEWRAYLGIIVLATLFLTINLFYTGIYTSVVTSLRHASFIAVSIMTTTGFGTEDFHQWSETAKGGLLLLMFVGGCAGSTGGGMKVIRWMLYLKCIMLEVEHAFRPNVVRPFRLAGITLDKSIRHDVIVYFSLILFIFISGCMLLAAIEPDDAWLVSGQDLTAEKLLDCASAVAATLNNIGPGLGVLGPTNNYSHFSPQGKLLLTLLMLLGRLELFAIMVLFVPSFWRNQ